MNMLIYEAINDFAIVYNRELRETDFFVEMKQKVVKRTAASYIKFYHDKFDIIKLA